MWQAIKLFFGFGTVEVEKVEQLQTQRDLTTKDYVDSLPEVENILPMPPVKPPAPKPIQAPRYTRANVRRSHYYRRGGEYYLYEDDSIILDMALIMVLMDMFSAEDDLDFIESNSLNVEELLEPVVEVAGETIVLDAALEEVETTVNDIDAAVEAVAASMPDPAPYVAPVVEAESTSTYSGGSDYSGSSSTYSGGSDYSGSSDSGSSDSGSSDSSSD